MTERGILKVSRRSWHGRMYLYWKEHGEVKNSPLYKENLCHYVRVVLLWGPLRMFWHGKPIKRWDISAAAYTAMIVAATAYIAAWVLVPLNTLIATGFVILMGAAIFAGGIMMEEIDAKVQNRRDRKWAALHGRPMPEPDPKGIALLWTWFRSKKQRVCPLIEVNGEHR